MGFIGRRPTVEIVSHCWQYPRLLAYQLSGLVLHPPDAVNVRATVYYTRDDPSPVPRVLTEFMFIDAPGVIWDFRDIQRSHLLRRAIGRNRACQQTTADVVIFTDCDYVYGPGSLDEIAEAMLSATGPKLGYVRRHMASIDHEAGDAEIAYVDGPGIYEVTPERYQLSELSRAIGGSQIVLGDWARQHGYLPNSRRYQRPADTWKRTYEDAHFRRTCGLESLPIDCPTVYRIRHSKRGRFHEGVQL